jgi:hypothetical protein
MSKPRLRRNDLHPTPLKYFDKFREGIRSRLSAFANHALSSGKQV